MPQSGVVKVFFSDLIGIAKRVGFSSTVQEGKLGGSGFNLIQRQC